MKTCFVICPLGKPKSDTRRTANALLKHIIKPIATKSRYKVIRADLTPEHERTIPESISKHILEDDLVIADLTSCNANVFYELGKRHAWGGRCIHLTQDMGSLPFDIRHHRVIDYDLSDPDRIDEVKRELSQGIRALENIPPQCPFPLTPKQIIELADITVVIERYTGRRDHYYLADRIANSDCKRIFLMQRSSSFILGPEQGWGAEETFYHTILQKIEEGVEFFHVVSLEGIARHLKRPQSIFPETEEALNRLYKNNTSVGIKGKNKVFYFKRIPEEEDEHDLKPDRQARTLIIETVSGESECALVVDLGGEQSCFHLKGSKINKFMKSCLDYYDRWPLLKWKEIENIVKPEG